MRQRDAEQQRERRARAREQERRQVVLARARAVVASVRCTDESPAVRVRERLAAARAARVPFDAAWEVATGHLGDDWTGVLQETRSAWAAAYERRPTAGLDALAAIEGVGAADDAERISGPMMGAAVSS